MYSQNRYLPYSRQLIEEDDILAVSEVLRSDYLTTGPMVGKFEKALADYCGAKYAVVVASGTAALHAAYYAAGLKDGDEIITSPITFAATSNAALYLNAKPRFVDIEKETGNIDPTLIKEQITDKTKILAPVHYSGHPVDLDRIDAIAKEHGLVVVEDAAHAIGAEYNGKKIGGLSDMTILSFHPVKPMTTGEGGAVLTNNEEFYERLRLFRTHGITKSPDSMEAKDQGPWYYEMQDLGFNSRITDMQCALGLSQLKKMDRFVKERRAIAEFYCTAFQDLDEIEITYEKEYSLSSWHLYPIRLKGSLTSRRREIFEKLRANKIWCQVHYIPVYLQPYYRRIGYSEGLCPQAEQFYSEEISIPVFQGMLQKEMKYVVDVITDSIR